MNIIFKLAWRNIWRNKRRSIISMASVFFAVFSAINAESFQRGTYDIMINNMVHFSTGYLQIQDVLYNEEPSIDNTLLYSSELQEVLEKNKNQIDYYVPRLQSFSLAATDEVTRGVMIMGIDIDKEHKLNNIKDNIIKGDFPHVDEEAVVLTEGLSHILKIGVGDTLVLIGQGFQGVNAAAKFPVKGIIKLSIPDMNNNTVYVPLKAAQWYYDATDRLTSVIVMPINPDKTDIVAKSLQKDLDNEWYAVYTWKFLLADLLKLMEFDVAGNKLILGILYIIIGFGLFGTVLTMVLERLKEFGMLISLGMKRFQLALICFFETLFLAFMGVGLGALWALPLVLYFNKFPIELTGEMSQAMLEYGFEPILPFALDVNIFLNQAIIIFIISMLIGLYPIFKIAKLNVVDVKKI